MTGTEIKNAKEVAGVSQTKPGHGATPSATRFHPGRILRADWASAAIALLVLLRFKGSMQHRLVELMLVARRVLRQG